MKYPPPAPGEEREDPFFYSKSAEKAFGEFIRQVAQKQAKGFISEGENGLIFSFETYLRETGHSADEITGFCKYATAVNLLAKFAVKKSKNWSALATFFIKGFVPLIGLAFAITLLLYLLVAILLLVFGVSLWSRSSFFPFITIGTGVVLVFILAKVIKRPKKAGGNVAGKRPLYVIKYFDTDELKFTKAKSRLFVEK